MWLTSRQNIKSCESRFICPNLFQWPDKQTDILTCRDAPYYALCKGRLKIKCSEKYNKLVGQAKGRAILYRLSRFGMFKVLVELVHPGVIWHTMELYNVISTDITHGTQLLNGKVYFQTGSFRVPQGPHDTSQLPKMDFVGHMFTKQKS